MKADFLTCMCVCACVCMDVGPGVCICVHVLAGSDALDDCTCKSGYTGSNGGACTAAWTAIPAVSVRARAPRPGSLPRAPQTRPGIACSQRCSLCACGAPSLLGSV